MGKQRLAAAITLLAVVLAVSFALAVSFGATTLSWRGVMDGDEIARSILFRIRIPRILTGALVGAALAVAGLTFQTLLRNPLADPFILGVSGGAACGAAISTALGFARIPGFVPTIAFVGACL